MAQPVSCTPPPTRMYRPDRARWDRHDRHHGRHHQHMSIAAPEVMTVVTTVADGWRIAADHGEGRRSFSVGGCRPAVEPSTPRIISRPTLDPMVRAADLAARLQHPVLAAAALQQVAQPATARFGRLAGAASCWRCHAARARRPEPRRAGCARRPRWQRRRLGLELLVGRSRSTVFSYTPATSDWAIRAWRCAGVIGPIWLPGGTAYTRWVTPGRPLSSSRLIRASPTASSVMAVAMSRPGLAHRRRQPTSRPSGRAG